jgi:predicted membrane protein
MLMPTGSDSRFILTPRLVLGVCIALLGVTLTLDRLRIIDADVVLRYFWPVGMMVIGGLMIAQSETSRGRTRGIVLAAIGTWIFLSIQGILPASIWELFWPVMLIVIGVSLALQTSRRNVRTADGQPMPASSRLSTFSVWSSCKRTSNANPFRGGDITAVMGGAQIDLRTATIPPGEEASLDILAIMGGVEVYVPSHWILSTPIVPFMGGIEDKRLAPLGADPRLVTKDAAPRLVIRGFVMMGGVRINN